MRTIALDAFGSDHAPSVEIEGAIAAAQSGKVRVLLVGDQARLEKELASRSEARNLPIEIRHASQIITMHDVPSVAFRRKPDASMRVAINLVKSGEAEAAVSAGNSGAMLACSLFVLKRLTGVERPAIITTFPTRKGEAALLDMGANVDCLPLHLAQFAVMGAVFAQKKHGKAKPRVGVLSNGSEEHKGIDLTRATNHLLEKNPVDFEYIGYVEGRDIFSGDVDVVVTDGFTGNIVLKVTEGTAETVVSFLKESIKSSWLISAVALAMKPAFVRMKRRMDYAEQGGAPLLGLDGVGIICHGGSNAKAIKNALLNAGSFVDADLAGNIKSAIANHHVLIEAARALRLGEEEKNNSARNLHGAGEGSESKEEDSGNQLST